MKIINAVSLIYLFSVMSSIALAGSAKISIYVTPFYNSEGPEINVGKYSEQLKTNEPGIFKQTVHQMQVNKEILTPEQMFVASIRLYELGEKDEAVYWFYEAQYRARLFNEASIQSGGIGDKAFELKSAYGSFMQLAGNEINGYAGCDPDHWVAALRKVKDANKHSPDLETIFPGVKFVDKGKWDELNNKVSAGMAGLLNYIEQNKPTLKQQRAANNADEKYCK